MELPPILKPVEEIEPLQASPETMEQKLNALIPEDRPGQFPARRHALKLYRLCNDEAADVMLAKLRELEPYERRLLIKRMHAKYRAYMTEAPAGNGLSTTVKHRITKAEKKHTARKNAMRQARQRRRK